MGLLVDSRECNLSRRDYDDQVGIVTSNQPPPIAFTCGISNSHDSSTRPNCHVSKQPVQKFIHSGFVGSAHPFSNHEKSDEERDCQQRNQKEEDRHGDLLRTRLACLGEQQQCQDAEGSGDERDQQHKYDREDQEQRMLHRDLDIYRAAVTAGLDIAKASGREIVRGPTAAVTELKCKTVNCAEEVFASEGHGETQPRLLDRR